MVNFDNTTAKILKKIHFQPKGIKFLLGYIQKLNTKILEINKNKKGLLSVEK